MAIEKNNFKVSRFDSEFSPGSRGSMSSDEDELRRRSSAVESDDEDEFDDADSGAGSDDFDLLELGETGAEFCQIENQSCAVPFELYDLPNLQDILSLDVWNDILTEEDRFSLAHYLPDMDQHSFMHTLKDLFSGCNFHFGSPVTKLFDMLRGGYCEPRVALYRQALDYFQRRQHYHLLRMRQNNMVGNLCQIRDAWQNCKGYSIEERLQVLNIVRSQKSLMYEKMEDVGVDSGGASTEREELGEVLRSKRVKDKRVAKEPVRHSAYETIPTLDFPSQGKRMALEPENYGKKNPKGLLKLAGSRASSMIKSGPCNSVPSLSRKHKVAGCDSGAAFQLRDQIRSYDVPEVTMYEVPLNNVSRGLKLVKKREHLRGDGFPSDSSMGLPSTPKDVLAASGRIRNASMIPEKPLTANLGNTCTSHDYAKKIKHADNFQQSVVEGYMMSAKGRAQRASLKGNGVNLSDGAEPFLHGNMQGEAFFTGPSLNYDDWNVKTKKSRTGRESSDLKLKSFKASSPQIDDGAFNPEYGTKTLDNFRGNSRHTGEPDRGGPKGIKMFDKNEDTESGSSEPDDDEEDDNLFIRSKLGHTSSLLEGHRSSLVKSGVNTKEFKAANKDKKMNEWALDGRTLSSRRRSDVGENVRMLETGNHFLRAKKKGKMRESSHLHKSASRIVEDGYIPGLGKLNDDDERKGGHKLGKKNGQVQGIADEKLHLSPLQAYSAERRQRGEASHDYSAHQLNHFHDNSVDEEDDSLETCILADGVGATGILGKIGQSTEAFENDSNGRDVPLLGCKSGMKKRKLKDDVVYRDNEDEYDDLLSNTQQRIDETFSPKKHGKCMLEAATGSLDIKTIRPPVAEIGATDEMEFIPQKKPFTLITPTVHTGFSFSIIHLLSAVRMAMITSHLEDSLNVGNHSERSDGLHWLEDELNKKHDSINGFHYSKDTDINNNISEYHKQMNVPSLTVQEVVNRLRSNPGDPCILETQEPLQDLVRGVLKIFSSKTAPLGAKGWKALVFYEKSTKSWSWVGPVSHSTLDHESIEEVTSPEAWGLPHKMLLKLVDSFANWLKSGQETLQQIGSLPAPPLVLMQFNLDEKERFKDLRAQKSLTTISPSSEEVRAYFQKEEFLRYSVPDRAFAYTAADGRKSIVAPLRRCGGKPTSKARDHFMLKRDRPPHVTILCLVRDAASRLPGSIGTRADVCTLIRDSQYIVEDISDAQVNQVVSGALDRLHYERDPCVQFDGERKLWVYLHTEREEEDFEDDGTSSTKKWKRPKKDAVEQFDQATASVAYSGTGERTAGSSAAGFDLTSHPNIEPLCLDDDNRLDFMYDAARQTVKDNDEYAYTADQGTGLQFNPMVWEALGLNTLQDSNFVCQENSANEDFGDEAEKPAEFFSAALL